MELITKSDYASSEVRKIAKKILFFFKEKENGIYLCFGESTALLDWPEKGYQFSCCRAQTSYQQPIRMKLLLWENCIIYQMEHFFHLSLKQLGMVNVKGRVWSKAGHWFWHTLALPVSLRN